VSPPPIPEALFQSKPTITARLQEPETKKPEVKPETKPSKPKTKTKKTASIAKKETYSVQAGAFFNSKDAETLKATLRKKGYTVYIQSTKTPEGKTIYRVRVGKFKDKKAAELLALRLKKTEGIDAFVIKRK
jgi:DedD protein